MDTGGGNPGRRAKQVQKSGGAQTQRQGQCGCAMENKEDSSGEEVRAAGHRVRGVIGPTTICF